MGHGGSEQFIVAFVEGYTFSNLNMHLSIQ